MKRMRSPGRYEFHGCRTITVIVVGEVTVPLSFVSAHPVTKITDIQIRKKRTMIYFRIFSKLLPRYLIYFAFKFLPLSGPALLPSRRTMSRRLSSPAHSVEDLRSSPDSGLMTFLIPEREDDRIRVRLHRPLDQFGQEEDGRTGERERDLRPAKKEDHDQTSDPTPRHFSGPSFPQDLNQPIIQ